MQIANHPSAGDVAARAQEDLRQRIAMVLLERVTVFVGQGARSALSENGIGELDAESGKRLGHLMVELLAVGVRDGHMDPRSGFIADLCRLAIERSVAISQLFAAVCLTEQAALDGLAADELIGATTRGWPIVAQLVRRASFDLLAAYSERSQSEPTGAAITDRLTTLYTRPMLDAALAKEMLRASRYGDALSLILFDVDRLGAMNAEHGYGVGDRILERLGILARGFFRQQDWVARHGEDSMAVLLTRTEAADASDLAERLRAAVEERLGFLDHRTDQSVPVTVSAAVVNVSVDLGELLDPARLMADAETALERAKQLGRNRVERVDGYSGERAIPADSRRERLSE